VARARRPRTAAGPCPRLGTLSDGRQGAGPPAEGPELRGSGECCREEGCALFAPGVAQR
jgi:hypothetical protein